MQFSIIHHKKTAPFALFALAAAFLACAISLRPGPAPGASSGPVRTTVLSSALSNVLVINTRGTKTLWTATSQKAALSGSGATARLTDVSIDMPAQDTKLVASGGLLDLDNYTLTLEGGVKSQVKGFNVKTKNPVRIVPGGRLNTGRDGLVYLEKKGMEIRGRGLRANEEKKVRLDSDVKAIFY